MMAGNVAIYKSVLILIFFLFITSSQAFQEDWSTARISDEPEFLAPIHNLTIPVGREATLSCTVSNLGRYKVAWVRAEDQTILSLHTKVVTHNSRISVTHDNLRTWQLRIRQLKESDRGCYMCQINTSIMKIQQGCLDVYAAGITRTCLTAHSQGTNIMPDSLPVFVHLVILAVFYILAVPSQNV